MHTRRHDREPDTTSLIEFIFQVWKSYSLQKQVKFHICSIGSSGLNHRKADSILLPLASGCTANSQAGRSDVWMCLGRSMRLDLCQEWKRSQSMWGPERSARLTAFRMSVRFCQPLSWKTGATLGALRGPVIVIDQRRES